MTLRMADKVPHSPLNDPSHEGLGFHVGSDICSVLELEHGYDVIMLSSPTPLGSSSCLPKLIPLFISCNASMTAGV